MFCVPDNRTGTLLRICPICALVPHSSLPFKDSTLNRSSLQKETIPIEQVRIHLSSPRWCHCYLLFPVAIYHRHPLHFLLILFHLDFRSHHHLPDPRGSHTVSFDCKS